MSAHHMSGELELVLIVIGTVGDEKGSCQAKIGKLGPQAGIQEDVAGLQIVVDTGRVGEVVEIVESISDVVGNLNPLLP